MTIRSYLEKWAKETPQAVAMKYCNHKVWEEITYAEFLLGVRKIGSAYGARFELKPQEDNVALILQNGPTWMESYLSCSGAGVSVVPIDPKLHTAEIEYILQDSGAVVVTTDKEHLIVMERIAAKLPKLRAIVLTDGDGSYKKIADVPVYDYASLKQDDCTWYDNHVAKEEDVASVIYTSGTTGRPKGALLTQKNFVSDAQGAIAAFGEPLYPHDIFLVILPLFHAFSFCTNFIVPLVIGAGMHFVRSLYTIGEDVKLLKPSIIMSVPLLAEKVYDKIDANLKTNKVAQILLKTPLKCVVVNKIKKGLGGNLRFMIVGGAPCPKHVLEGYKQLGIAVLEGYGLTECSPVVSIAGPKCARIGTIGMKLPNIEIRLADQNESGVGELQIKGPITMKGYYHNDEATAEAFDGEWLKTGDLASIDELGLITIRGRKKALIVNREGKNIYPEEVENFIGADPIVSDVVVVGYTTGGIPGEKVGCVVHPNVELLTQQNNGVEMQWDAMEKIARAHVQAQCQRLADYKRVRKVIVSHEPLERTSIQKVRRVAYKGTLDE